MHLRELAVHVKEGIRAAGGTPIEFNTIVVSDGISMGTEGMRASLVSREVIADSIELAVRGAMKPLPTLTKPLRSVDIATHEPAEALRERTDSCTVPAAGVVGEAMVAFVLADAYRRKFGGDHIDDVRQAVGAYRERIGWTRR